jgi:hypothetical protein
MSEHVESPAVIIVDYIIKHSMCQVTLHPWDGGGVIEHPSPYDATAWRNWQPKGVPQGHLVFFFFFF